MEKLGMDEFKRLYEACNVIVEPKRTVELSRLMDEVQAVYQIPLFKYESFAEINPEVFALYQQISKAREL